MECKHCKAAREALFQGRLLEATKHVVKKFTAPAPKKASVKQNSGAAGKQPKK